MARGEVHQVVTFDVWSALLPVGGDGALPDSHPRRMDAASTVVVLALGAGCLHGAVVFQRDAALPDDVQPRRAVPYQIGALRD